MLRGTTHRSGMTERSWHKRFVVARRIVEEQALRAIQSRYLAGCGASGLIDSEAFPLWGDMSTVDPALAPPRICQAIPKQRAINAKEANDQTCAWPFSVRSHSRRKG